MSYKLAIFDLDGTILDTLEDLTNAVNYILIQYERPTRTPAEIRSYLGNGVVKLIECAFGDSVDGDTLSRAVSEYRVYYGEHADIKTRPYSGIPEMLAELRAAGVKTAVLSNKPDAPTKALCKRYFDGLFHIAAGEKEGIVRKPAPDGVYPILEELGVSACDAVYIGDSEVDIETAKNSEMDGISVAWGFRDVDYLKKSGASVIVYSADELKRAILS